MPLGQASSVPKTSTVLHFDAKWWQHADSDGHQGFIYGYRDCHQPPDAPKVSIVEEQKFVSKAVDAQPGTPDAVTAAIHLAWTTMKSQPILKGAEIFTGPHGFLDGEWWGDFSGPRPSEVSSNDRGYVEGYLDCAASPVKAQAVHRYQAGTDRHYASGRHSHDKVADVLQGLLKASKNNSQ